jgi:hypothetical protein
MTDKISEASSPTGPAQNMKSNGAPIWLVVAIATLASAIGSYITWSALRSQASDQKVVVVDMGKLAVAKGFASATDRDAAEAAAKKFLIDMDALNESYSKNGILVLNSQVAFNRPIGSDVTNVYAKALDVDLTKAQGNNYQSLARTSK